MKRLTALICTSLLAGTAFTGLFGLAPQAIAQSNAACRSIEEEIVPLRVPNFDVPILWKRTMGVDGPDAPVDVISLADSGLVVVGESAEYSKDKGVAPRKLYLARVDVNGKIVWEKRVDIKGFANAAAGIAIKDRLAILSEIAAPEKNSFSRVDFFDGLGALKATYELKDEKYNLLPQGISSDAASNSLTVALWAVNRKNPDDNFTVIKRLSLEGKTLARHEYLPGVPNRLESFRRTIKGNYMGVGQIKSNGFASGWVFAIDGKSGDLIFQRPYTRGFKSILRGIAEDGHGNYIVAGDSMPTDGGLRAAWIMKIDGGGKPLWQKYIQGKYAFSGRDIGVTRDGRILLLVNARPLGKEGGREHVRLMTFTPQGKMQGDEALIEGANAQAVDLVIRENSRIVTGVTQEGLKDYSLAKDEKGAGYDFWVLGLPKLSNFEDPCSTVDVHDSFDEGF